MCKPLYLSAACVTCRVEAGYAHALPECIAGMPAPTHSALDSRFAAALDRLSDSRQRSWEYGLPANGLAGIHHDNSPMNMGSSVDLHAPPARSSKKSPILSYRQACIGTMRQR